MRRAAVVVAIAISITACAPKGRPNVAPLLVWRVPDVPAALAGSAERARYEDAWARVQGGDAAAGERIFVDIDRRAKRRLIDAGIIDLQVNSDFFASFIDAVEVWYHLGIADDEHAADIAFVSAAEPRCQYE